MIPQPTMEDSAESSAALQPLAECLQLASDVLPTGHALSKWAGGTKRSHRVRQKIQHEEGADRAANQVGGSYMSSDDAG